MADCINVGDVCTVTCAAPTTRTDGTLIDDILTFQLYINGQPVEESKDECSFAFQAQQGTYTVTAIDSSGHESAPSQGFAAINSDTDGDGIQNSLDTDDDNDGLSDSFETSIGIDPLWFDTDRDGLSDYDEVAYDGYDTSYVAGQDLNPLSRDTDFDGYFDDVDPIPLTYNFADGDLAPLGSPDGVVNAADYLIATRISLGMVNPTLLELSHGDVYPVGTPDGVINIQDMLLLQQRVLNQ